MYHCGPHTHTCPAVSGLFLAKKKEGTKEAADPVHQWGLGVSCSEMPQRTSRMVKLDQVCRIQPGIDAEDYFSIFTIFLSARANWFGVYWSIIVKSTMQTQGRVPVTLCFTPSAIFRQVWRTLMAWTSKLQENVPLSVWCFLACFVNLFASSTLFLDRGTKILSDFSLKSSNNVHILCAERLIRKVLANHSAGKTFCWNFPCYWKHAGILWE